MMYECVMCGYAVTPAVTPEMPAVTRVTRLRRVLTQNKRTAE